MANKSQKSTLTQLQKVCSKGDTRTHITTPWVHPSDLANLPGPWAVATDGYRLHACPLAEVPADSVAPPNAERPPIDAIVNRDLANQISLTLPHFANVIRYLAKMKADMPPKVKVCVNLRTFDAVIESTKWTYTNPSDRPTPVTTHDLWVNLHYLLAALDWCGDGIATLCYGDALEQIVIANTSQRIAIVMPVRV